MQQHHQPYVDRRRSELRNNNKKTAYDDFYTKLERIRLSAAAASSSSSSKFLKTRRKLRLRVIKKKTMRSLMFT